MTRHWREEGMALFRTTPGRDRISQAVSSRLRRFAAVHVAVGQLNGVPSALSYQEFVQLTGEVLKPVRDSGFRPSTRRPKTILIAPGQIPGGLQTLQPKIIGGLKGREHEPGRQILVGVIIRRILSGAVEAT